MVPWTSFPLIVTFLTLLVSTCLTKSLKVRTFSGLPRPARTTCHKRTATQINTTQKIAVLIFEFTKPPYPQDPGYPILPYNSLDVAGSTKDLNLSWTLLQSLGLSGPNGWRTWRRKLNQGRNAVPTQYVRLT